MPAVDAKQVKVIGRLKRIVGFPLRYKESDISFFSFLVQKRFVKSNSLHKTTQMKKLLEVNKPSIKR